MRRVSSPSPGRLRGRGDVTLKKIHRLDIQSGPLMKVLEASPKDPDKVIKALEQSPVLSARVLSVTNSAAIGVVGEISDIRRAVVHMGASRARSIAMAFGMQLLSEQSGLDPEAARLPWINSMEKAHLAQLVAKHLDPAQADTAYSLGLVQDIGLSALMAIDPAFYHEMAENPKPDTPLPMQEQERFGIDHAAVGNHLLSQWNASPLLCEEVLNHHQPLLSQPQHSVSNLAGLIAGMLPHNGEPMTQGLSEWLTAVHGQFLSSRYDTPEDLIKAAVQAAKEVHCGAPTVKIMPSSYQRMLDEIVTDTTAMVRHLCEMEGLLSSKHEQLSALQFEAITDPLTQLLNRRGFQRMAERRLDTAIERGLPVCAVAIDLDEFKQINDTFGHDAGDMVLTEVARLLKQNLNSSDLISRLGGDELVVFLINVDKPVAEQIVRRVTKACHGQTIEMEDGRSIQISFSVGAATCEKPTTKTRVMDMVAAADEAMYQSKKAGSGEITFADFPAQKKAS